MLAHNSELYIKMGGCDASRWSPITLISGGMFHLSFGAILGVTSWKRSSEQQMDKK